MNFRILILCTGNYCRSQMAEGILKSLDKFPLTKGGIEGGCLEVLSAGTEPASQINQFAVKVMEEIGIDISSQYPKSVEQFLGQSFDYVITVCDNAKENCPVFYGKVQYTLHYGIPDPADASGTDEVRLSVYRKTRDQIKEIFNEFYNSISTPNA